MARKIRVEFAGACYHVINRGNYRRDIFAQEDAAAAFEHCVFEAARAFRWRLHAYVIMRNHFHFAVELTEPNLSLGMKWLQGTWAARFNRFRRLVGRPFQGRFKAIHVEPGHALAQVCHYIHLNPVRAGIVPLSRVADYAWSSLRRYVSPDRPATLEGSTLLAESGGLDDTAAGWRCYLDYLRVIGEDNPTSREHRFGLLSRGWAIGSPQFRSMLQAELRGKVPTKEALELLGADREAHIAARAAGWEEALSALAGRFGVDLNRLPPRKSAREKVLLAAAMKALTSASNGWLAQRLNLGKTSSVSSLVRRFRQQGHQSSAVFQEALSRFTT